MKYISLILIITILPFALFAQIPNWAWANVGNDPDYGYGESVTKDAQDNVYIVGIFTDSLQIGNTTFISPNNVSSYLAKYSATGQLLWAKKGGGKGETGTGIAVDNSGYVYVLSTFKDTAIYGNSILISKGASDLCLTKYDSNGNVIWAKSWGSTYPENGGRLIIDSKNNLYMNGTFAADGGSPPSHGTIDFDSIILTSHGNGNIFTVKLDTSGNIKWARCAGGINGAFLGGICLDSSGNVFITGTGGDPMYFDNYSLLHQSVFIAKYDSSGNIQWAQGGIGGYGTTIAADKMGNVYASGYSDQQVNFQFGSYTLYNQDQAYLVKYNVSGTLLWAKNLSTYCFYDEVLDMLVDSANNIYLAGHFNYLGVFGGDTLLSNGHDDILIQKLDSNGNHIWATHAGGITNDGAAGIALDHSGNLLVTGYVSSDPAYFGAYQVNAYNYWDMFVAKLSGTTGIPIISSSPNDLELYPNPSSGILHLKANKENFTSLKVFDQLGRVVAEQSLQQHQTAIDVHQLTDGIYYLQLKGKGLPETKKIIIQH